MNEKTWMLRAAIRSFRMYEKRNPRIRSRKTQKSSISVVLDFPFEKPNNIILKQAKRRINNGKTIKLP